MAKLEDRIRSRIEEFAQELTDLIRQSALESVAAAVGRGAPARGPGRRPGRPSAAAASARARVSRRPKGAKRSPEELEQLTSSLQTYIGKNPGQRIEQIGKGMSISTKELTLSVKKLIAARAIKTKGQKRATQYFPK